MNICKNCGNTNEAELSRHHVFPRRFYGNRKRNKIFVVLCGLNSTHNCHFRLEEFIAQREGGVRQEKEFYLNCLIDFLKDENNSTLVSTCGGMDGHLDGNHNHTEL